MQKSTIFPEIKTACRICFLLLLSPLSIWCQWPLGFEDGALPLEQFPPGRWGIDSLDPISGRYSLHHTYDNSEAACDYFMMPHGIFTLSRPGDSIFTGDSLSFSFRLRHGYAPSSVNNWQLALLADFDEVIREGIVLGVNLEGSDDLLSLWRARDGVYEELCSAELNYQEDVGTDIAPLFRLSWQWDGQLVLWLARDLSDQMQPIASCILHDLPEGGSLVARYEYSAAQDRKLWLDDLLLEGRFLADTMKPELSQWTLENSACVRLIFSETIRWPDSVRAELSLPGPTALESVFQGMVADSFSLQGAMLELFFPDPLPNREPVDLLLGGLCDRAGNCMDDTVFRIMRNEAVWGDMLINELLADPEPEVGISIGEYVEFFNASDYILHLEGWRLEVGARIYELTEEGVDTRLGPAEYLLLSGVSLPNQGAMLALYNRGGELIHAASYRIPHDAPEWKKDGGWSLESPDPEQVCNISQLWEYSEDPSGGTPGRLNSVDGERPDYQEPVFLYYGFGEAGDLWLYFSEPLILSAQLPAEWCLSPGNFKAVEISSPGPLSETIICHFTVEPSLFSRFTFYMPALSDCQGNLCGEFSFNGGPAVIPEPGSVIINEIMYDPSEGSVEYIEIYNPGQRFIDLRDLGLALSSEEEPFDKILRLSEYSRMMAPGDYLVLSESIPWLRDAYGLEISGSWVELEEMMSLPDGGGKIWLTDRSGNTVDVVSYNDEMHMELISDTRGISLERIDPVRVGSDALNWHSAASIEGYASPGRLNSQALPASGREVGLAVEPLVFSPDNDGYEDLLLISPGVKESGTVIRLWITTPEGRLVRSLANNHVAGPSSQYPWDGRDEGGGMAAEGFYIVHLRAYHPLISGSSYNQKLAVGLIYR